MKTVACPPWCAKHERDHEGTLLHTGRVTFPVPSRPELAVNVERYDLPAGEAGDAEDQVWLGCGIAVSEDDARLYAAEIVRRADVIAAARRARAGRTVGAAA